MSNNTSICWKCKYMNSCRRFRKDPEAKVTECGTFVMKDEIKEIHNALHNFFAECPQITEGMARKK